MKLECEVSVRHVHLSAADVDVLFGVGYELTPTKDLSQPGQYLCAERVELVTEKATIKNVGIIGPTRKITQVEVSRTDCFTLGLKNVPLRQSGELDNAPTILVRTERGSIHAAVIIAQRHVHMDTQTATKSGYTDGQIVAVKFDGERGGTLYNTVLRVHADFAPRVHIDSDDANAMGFTTGMVEICAEK
ncbi:MAG: phosphate propanoyltransferase [Firmicutes bacterium]|nr:phosphate propanoyltransferase [Bacillota bacterium]